MRQKNGISAAKEAKSGAQGELDGTVKEIQADTTSKSELHHECMAKAQSFEVETNDRDAEIAVLAKAKDIIRESVKGAALGQVSLVQVAASQFTDRFESKSEAVRLIRELGHKDGSNALLQLASNMAKALRSTGGDDPFAKVKAMISDMIEKLEGQASEEARKKAYCDKELGDTKEKASDTEDDVDALGTKIDKMTGKAADLKGDVKTLKLEELLLTKSLGEMQTLYREDRTMYESTKAKVSKGLNGIQKAIAVLKDYYSKSDDTDSSGAANSIIGLLEESESKMSKWLMDVKTDEQSAKMNYDSFVGDNKADMQVKVTEEKYKEKGTKKLDKSSSETKTDRASEQEQLDAVEDYMAKLKKECVAKPDSYEEREKRRSEEMEGLRRALDILSSESAASLLQISASSRRSTLRGAFARRRQHTLAA